MFMSNKILLKIPSVSYVTAFTHCSEGGHVKATPAKLLLPVGQWCILSSSEEDGTTKFTDNTTMLMSSFEVVKCWRSNCPLGCFKVTQLITGKTNILGHQSL